MNKTFGRVASFAKTWQAKSSNSEICFQLVIASFLPLVKEVALDRGLEAVSHLLTVLKVRDDLSFTYVNLSVTVLVDLTEE